MVDKELFHQRYVTFYPKVKSYFLGKGFPPEDAEELTQDVFFRVFKFEDDCRDAEKFSGWLNTIAANTWKNKIRELRSQKRDGVEIPMDAPGWTQNQYLARIQQPLPLEHTIREEMRDMLRQAIGQLPDTVYACVVLRVYHELSYEQVAQILGIPYERVKSRLYQAQTKLKAILGQEVHVNFVESSVARHHLGK